MKSLVIAAIPDENDRVWKVSSEKVPHLTVLYLGDDASQVANVDKIIEFVEHAATMTLKRFYLPVDRRDELGEDPDLGPADVLFFKKGRYDYKAIRDFRATLLQNSAIKTAYDNAPQFDGPWLPHLTLGYEKRPANAIPDNDISTFYDVSFNKIAVWTGDYEGPEFLLKDYWDEMDMMESVPMDMAMSSLNEARMAAGMAVVHAVKPKTKATVSETPWSNFKDSDYTDEQYARACLLDRGADVESAKERYSLPVREPDGTLNKNGMHAAAAVLSSTGGTGSARGNKVKGTDEQIAAAKKKLIALYKSHMDGEMPQGLMDKSMMQTIAMGEEFLAHYGVKGMKWGQRKEDLQGESRPQKSRWDPEGHSLVSDVVKNVGFPIILPGIGGILAIPSSVRLVRGGARAGRAKGIDINEKRFAKKAQSAKTFAKIHNKAAKRLEDDLVDVNMKYPAELTSKQQKKYDEEVRTTMQKAYRETANSIGNRANTMHLDLEFRDNGMDFAIKAREGAPTPTTERVKHAADDDETVEFTGKIKRAPSGHIIGLSFDDFETQSESAKHSDLAADFMLEHYGIKGMHWGVRNSDRFPPRAVAPTGVSRVPQGNRRKTKIKVEGGQNHPAHEDAIKVAEAKAKIKKSGVAALSNKELRDVRERVQLEEQVKGLMTSRGRKFVTRQLESQGQQGIQRGVQRGAPVAIRTVRRGAAIGATTAALV